MADMTLEEALAASTVNSSTDSDILTISNDLRTITIPESIKNLGVESDEDVNRIHFKMPKMYKDVDLTDFDIRINYINGNDGDKYIVEDKTISEDYITFSWLVGRNALKTKGSTRFIVCLKKTDSEGIVQKEFNTTLASINVLEGLETTEQIMQKYPDVIEQILKKIEGSTTITPDQISEAVEEYMTANQIQAGATEEQAKQIEKNMQDISKLSDDIANKEESGTAEVKITAHNTSTDAHNDIRLLIQNLVNTVTALLDSDDETLDQTSEIVAYIKSNKSLIDAITTSKVSVSDIIDNLTTNVANKPLSASQGVALKGLIDALRTELDGVVIPTKLPNPFPLVINGTLYDGSETVEVTVEDGTGGSSGGSKEWTLIFDKSFTDEDLSTVSYSFDVNDAEEVFVTLDSDGASAMSSETMGMNVKINEKIVSGNVGYKKDASQRHFRGYFKYVGDLWVGFMSENDYSGGATVNIINYIEPATKNVGKCKKITISQSLIQDYRIKYGTLKIYVR